MLGDELTMDEMTAVIQGMPNWIAVGPDSLPSELLKIGHPKFIRYFHNLLVNVWRTGNVPQHWKYATITVLHKTKDWSDCDNYPGISLLVHSGKVLLLAIFAPPRLQELGQARSILVYMCFIDL